MWKIFTGLWCLLLSIFIFDLVGRSSSEGITVDKCGTVQDHGKIVGGNEAKVKDNPWTVSLHTQGKHVCGGSVLNENWIITAAHCFVDVHPEPSSYEVFVGLEKQSEPDAANVQRVNISRIVMHEEHNVKTSENDIALLKTSEPLEIDINLYVNGICLPEPDVEPTGEVKVAGFGSTKSGGKPTDELREVTLHIISREECRKLYENSTEQVFDTMICANDKVADDCDGDSGGALIQTDSKNVSTQVGVVSYGISCGQERFPGVYTKLSSYISWMEKVISATQS